ncbi:pdz/dhr/glgf protein [Trueperella pecoris]|uniref:endopeptidase La n=1 Tax=Trueperella pecoris TaxID=2733571 RepID=A0A7M1R3H9_9ACTO|nr:S16 family serine protease [Trueperella pecoris]QOR48244.1 pdz/dhr/glgf protein [Trueperella pecoris]
MDFRRPPRHIMAGSVFLALLAVGAVMPTSYIVQSAGPVLDVTETMEGKEIVSVTGTQTHESDTHFLMTTVTSLGNADTGISGALVAGGLLNRSEEVVPVRALYPAQVSSSDIEERNKMLMTSSQDTAAAVAFEEAGIDVSMTLSIAGVPDDSPAAGVLKEGDVLTGIAVPSLTLAKAGPDGVVPVKTFRQLSDVLDLTPAGSEVVLHVQRGGEPTAVTTTTRGFEPDPTGWLHPGSALGVYVQVTDVKLPAQVSYVVEGIGGPSAGLMFTLAIFDAITPGSLGGASVIAGTGAIAWDGEIDPIGGIRHKLEGAREAGATDFLAPAFNCPETIGYEPDGLKIWAVRTIGQATRAASAIASGNTSGLTPCSALPDATK